MKKFGLSLFTVCLLASSAVLAEPDRATSSKIGEKNDDVPCTCVFNNKRAWNPEKISWKGEDWRCAHYNENGTCSKVEKVKATVE